MLPAQQCIIHVVHKARCAQYSQTSICFQPGGLRHIIMRAVLTAAATKKLMTYLQARKWHCRALYSKLHRGKVSSKGSQVPSSIHR